MAIIAQKIPGFDTPIPKFPGLKPELANMNLAGLVTFLLNITFYFTIFLVFFWIVWGAFEYLLSGGDKNMIANARKRIIYALIGLVVVVLSYSIAQFIEGAVGLKGRTPISLVSTVYADVDLRSAYPLSNNKTLGEGVSRLVIPVFSLAAAGLVIFFIYGGYKLLVSAGNKEDVAGAQKMITSAIIGFVLLMASFIVIPFLLDVLFGIKTLNFFN